MDYDLLERASHGDMAAFRALQLSIQRGEGMPSPREMMDEYVANMPPVPGAGHRGYVDGRRGWTRRTLIAAAEEVGRKVDGPVSVHRFCKLAKCSDATITRHFGGGWAELREEAGLQEAKRGTVTWTEELLLLEYDRLCGELERPPTWAEIDRLAEASSSTFRRVLGNRADIEAAHAEWLGNDSGEEE